MSTVPCPKCGGELSRGASACLRCGAPASAVAPVATTSDTIANVIALLNMVGTILILGGLLGGCLAHTLSPVVGGGVLGLMVIALAMVLPRAGAQPSRQGRRKAR